MIISVGTNFSCVGDGWYRSNDFVGKFWNSFFATQWLAKIMHSAIVSCISNGYMYIYIHTFTYYHHLEYVPLLYHTHGYEPAVCTLQWCTCTCLGMRSLMSALFWSSSWILTSTPSSSNPPVCLTHNIMQFEPLHGWLTLHNIMHTGHQGWACRHWSTLSPLLHLITLAISTKVVIALQSSLILTLYMLYMLQLLTPYKVNTFHIVHEKRILATQE